MSEHESSGEPAETSFHHRFVFESPAAPEGLALDRLHALRDVINTVKDEYPEVIGATVFGSSVQGRIKPTSDLDALVFIDANHAAEEGREPQLIHGLFGPRFDRLASPQYHKIVEQLSEATGMSADQTGKDIELLPISPSIVHESIRKSLAEAPARIEAEATIEAMPSDLQQQYVQAIHEYAYTIGDQAKQAYLAQLPSELDPNLVELPSLRVDMNVRGLFHLGINDQQLRPYRRQVIGELLSAGRDGKAVWVMLAKSVNYFERRDESTSRPPLSNKLADAAAQYGVELPESEAGAAPN